MVTALTVGVDQHLGVVPHLSLGARLSFAPTCVLHVSVTVNLRHRKVDSKEDFLRFHQVRSPERVGYAP